MAVNVTARVLGAFGSVEAEEVLNNVRTVDDVRERMSLPKGEYQSRVNKDAASDDYTIDSKDTVTFCRKGQAWPRSYLPLRRIASKSGRRPVGRRRRSGDRRLVLPQGPRLGSISVSRP